MFALLVCVCVCVSSPADQIAFYSDIDSAPVVQVARRKSITVIQDMVGYNSQLENWSHWFARRLLKVAQTSIGGGAHRDVFKHKGGINHKVWWRIDSSASEMICIVLGGTLNYTHSRSVASPVRRQTYGYLGASLAPNKTAWWQRQVCVIDLPRAVLDSAVGGWDSNPRPVYRESRPWTWGLCFARCVC